MSAYRYKTAPITNDTGRAFLVAAFLVVLVSCASPQPIHDFSLLASKSVKPATATHAKVIKIARTLLGTPYLYGGMTPNGFDCSGFIYYVYRKGAGIALPRVTHRQIEAGKPVAISALRIADIVYFKIGRTTYHTGIYIGKGKFIHAPSSRGNVNIQQLTTNYWATRYLGARRIF